jgi:hypothetical protein
MRKFFCNDPLSQNVDNPSYNGGREMILIGQIDKLITHLDRLDVI